MPGCLHCGGTLQLREKDLMDTRFGVPESYDIGACIKCGLEQLMQPPSQQELKRLYEQHYNFGGEQGTAYTSARRRFYASALYRLWIALDGDIAFHGVRAARPGMRLLDVGCNEGRGLDFFREHGFQAEGLELNPAAAAVARSRGFAVSTQLLEDHAPTEPYDVVVLSNVLEHTLDPVATARHAARVLRPGGELWISLPNARSWARSLFGRSWINWHVPFHITHFSAASLTRVLESGGLQVRKLTNVTPALWVAHSVIAAMHARRGRPTRQLRSAPLVAGLMLLSRGLLFPLLWMGNFSGRGDCLIAVAQRPAG